MQTINLNMIPGGVMPVINVTQFDEGRDFALKILNGSSAADLTGATVKISGRKKDGTAFQYSAADSVKGNPVVSVSGNTVTIRCTQQMAIVAGEVLATLTISKSASDISTLDFIILVQENPLSGADISTSEIPAIIALAQEQEETAEAYAAGTRDGVPVTSGDPAYHNNSKYYKDQAAAAATGVLEKYPKIINDYWYTWDVATSQYVNTGVQAKGSKGDTGAGVPSGGTTGQFLRKKSNTNYDTEWTNGGGGGLPAGGTAGQALVKQSSTEGDADWGTLPVAGGGTGATTEDSARANLVVPKIDALIYNNTSASTAVRSYYQGELMYYNEKIYQASKDLSQGDSLLNLDNAQVVTIGSLINHAFENDSWDREEGSTWSKSYNKGDYFLSNNLLTKITAANGVSQGQIRTSSTYEQVSIGAELSALNQSISADYRFGTSRTIASGEAYVAPTDGYLTLNVKAGKELIVYLRNPNDSYRARMDYSNKANTGNYYSLYIRKGIEMVAATYDSNTDGTVTFYPVSPS